MPNQFKHMIKKTKTHMEEYVLKPDMPYTDTETHREKAFQKSQISSVLLFHLLIFYPIKNQKKVNLYSYFI
jgi:hypothetical protein